LALTVTHYLHYNCRKPSEFRVPSGGIGAVISWIPEITLCCPCFLPVLQCIQNCREGSLIGASIGAGATLVHWLARRNSASVPAGAEIIFELSRPLMISTSASAFSETH